MRLKPLYGRQRRSMLRCALLACTGALLLSPLTLPVTFEAAAEAAPPATRPVTFSSLEPLETPELVVTHDPFVPSTAAGVPPVAGPAGTNADDSTLPVVRAIVVGNDPKALVDLGGEPQVIGLGSRLAGSVVTAIDKHGVTVQDGRHFAFAEPSP